MKYNSAKEVLSTFLEAFYKQFNLELALDCLAEDVVWIGIGYNDMAHSRKNLSTVLGANIKRIQQQFSVELEVPQEQPIQDGVSLWEFKVQHRSNVGLNILLKVRGTVICHYYGEAVGWKIISIHLSVPDAEYEKAYLQRKLEEEREKLQALLANVPGGVAVYRVKKDGTIPTEFVSDGLARICGYENGQELLEVIKDDSRKMVLAEDFPVVAQACKNSLEKGVPTSVNYRVHSKSGEPVRITLDSIVVQNAILAQDEVAVFYAVQTLLSDESIKNIENQRQLQELVNMVPGGIGIYDLVDGKLKLTYLNDAYYGMLGVDRASRESYYGDNVFDAVYEQDREIIKERLQDVLAGADSLEVLHRVRNGNGKLVWLQLTATVVKRAHNHIRMYASINDVDDMLRIQQEKSAARKREDMLLSAVPGAVVIYRMKQNGNMKFDYVSPGLPRMCGYEDVDEFLQKCQGDATLAIAPEDIPDLMAKTQECLNQEQPITAIYRLIGKDGQMVLNRLDAVAMDDGTLGEDDITLLYAIHTQVDESYKIALQEQSRYRNLVDTLDIALIEWSQQGGFYQSEKFAQYGLSKEPVENIFANKGNPQYVHPEDWPKLCGFFVQREKKLPSIRANIRFLMVDGSYRWTELLAFFEYDAIGRPKRITIVLRDMDKERIEQTKKLQQLLKDAKEASRAKADFYSRMSHDMRTPMNGILGMVALSKDEYGVEQLRNNIKKIGDSGEYMLSLVNDALDLQRIESGKMVLEPKIVKTTEVVDNILDMVRVTAEQKGVNLKYIVGNTDLNWYIKADALRLKQIFINLLSNAIKFTPAGGTVEFEFKLLKRDGLISHDVIFVRDTGVGMSQEFLQKGIFRPFSQESNGLSAKYPGSGLGLSIAKSLVELMGGYIEVESELGVGTTFSVYLDFERVLEQDVRHIKENKQEKTSNIQAKLAGKKILLVEDHPLNAEIATKLLEKMYCQVTWVANGALSVEKFSQEPPHTFDAILMDIRMPVMDGMEATKHIRALGRTDAQSIPIVAMTANAYEEDIKASLAVGMNAHLGKPVVPQNLYEVLAQVME